MEKTVGELTDELSIVNIRIWMLEDTCRNNCNVSEIGEAKKKINVCNQQRNNLIEAIDKKFGVENGKGSTKIYGNK